MPTTIQSFFTVGMSGLFTLSVPFDTKLLTGVSYRISAINSIDSLLLHALDVKKIIYLDQGLTEQQYIDDLNNRVDIVTLVSGNNPAIMLPSSYITKTPEQNVVPYYEPILGISLGLLPQALPLEILQQQIAALISDVIGVEVPAEMVKINALPVTKGIDATRHRELETIRENNIKNRTTDRALYLQAVEKNKELVQVNNELSKIIIEGGLALPTS